MTKVNSNIYWLYSFILLIICGGMGCDEEKKSSPEMEIIRESMDGGNPMGGRIMGGDEAESLGGEEGGEIVNDNGGVLNMNPMGGQTGGNLGGQIGGSSETMGGQIGGGEVEGGMIGGMTGGLISNDESCILRPEWIPPQQNGIVYLSHYLSPTVIQYRIDGEYPYEEDRFDVGAEVQDAAIDGQNQLYAVALDVARRVELYSLANPSNVGEIVRTPVLEATINLEPYTPRRLFFDSARQRLHVLTNAPLMEGQLLTEMFLFTYDVSQPNQPIEYGSVPHTMPVTTTLRVEPRAGTLALVELTTNFLYLYDVSGPTPRLLEGDPIDLETEFPEDGNQNGFQVRNLRFDPLRGRMMLARGQGPASEVITYAYPPIKPKDESTAMEEQSGCASTLIYDELTRIDDEFDVSIPPQDRVNLLGGYIGVPILGEPFIFFVSLAWNGFMATTLVSLMEEVEETGVISNRSGCEDFEGFGCFYRSFYNEQPGSTYYQTDGAACLDQNFQVFAGAGILEDENAQVFFYKYDLETGGMTPWISQEGRTLVTRPYPLHLGCY